MLGEETVSSQWCVESVERPLVIVMPVINPPVSDIELGNLTEPRLVSSWTKDEFLMRDPS